MRSLPLCSRLSCAIVAAAAFVFSAGHARAAAEPAKGDAAHMPAMPQPPALVAEYAKAMAGAWKCEGTGHMMGDAPTPMSGTMTFKLDPSKMWLVGTWKSKKTKGMPAMTSTEYRTYDPSQNKWIQVGVDSMGGWGTAQGTGTEPGDMVWEGEFFLIGMGGKPMKVKTTEKTTGPKEVRLESTGSRDGGATWQPLWEATCKK